MRTSSIVFWPASLLPRARTAAIAAAKAAAASVARGFVRKLLSQRQKQRSIERPRRAANFHHELRADGLEEIRQLHRRKRVQILQDRFEAALHVVPVIAVADGGVERRQFVDMGDDAVGDRDDQPALSLRVERTGLSRRASRAVFRRLAISKSLSYARRGSISTQERRAGGRVADRAHLTVRYQE